MQPDLRQRVPLAVFEQGVADRTGSFSGDFAADPAGVFCDGRSPPAIASPSYEGSTSVGSVTLSDGLPLNSV